MTEEVDRIIARLRDAEEEMGQLFHYHFKPEDWEQLRAVAFDERLGGGKSIHDHVADIPYSGSNRVALDLRDFCGRLKSGDRPTREDDLWVDGETLLLLHNACYMAGVEIQVEEEKGNDT